MAVGGSLDSTGRLGEDGGEERDYRPVSGLAVAALLAGCASAVALFAPPLLIVPLLAAGLAVLALRDVAQAALPKVGRGAALAALALAVGFGTQAAAWHAATHWITSRRVESIATALVTSVREGRLTQARGMFSPLVFTPPAGEDETGVPLGVRQEQAERNFKESPLVQALLACPTAVKAECRGYRPDSKEAKDAWLVRLQLAECPGKPARVIDMELQQGFRREASGLVENWSIESYQLDPR